MIYVYASIIALLWLALFGASFIGLISVSFDEGLFDKRWQNALISVFGLVLSISLLLWFVDKQASDKPCVKYETTMQYNAATKSTMPVRYCALEGEWIDE